MPPFYVYSDLLIRYIIFIWNDGRKQTSTSKNNQSLRKYNSAWTGRKEEGVWWENEYKMWLHLALWRYFCFFYDICPLRVLGKGFYKTFLIKLLSLYDLIHLFSHPHNISECPFPPKKLKLSWFTRPLCNFQPVRNTLGEESSFLTSIQVTTFDKSDPYEKLHEDSNKL